MKIARSITIAALGATALVACGGSDAGGDGESFCDTLTALDDSGVTPETDPEAAAEMLRDVADKAPSEIEEEFESFSDTLTAIVNEDADALEDIDFAEMEANITTIGEYVGENCEGLGDDVFDL